MPIGYLTSTGAMALCAALALTPPRPRRSSLFNLTFWFAFAVNELPFLAFYLLAGSTALAIGQSGTASLVFWLAFGLAVVASVELALIARRALRARPALELALSNELGTKWRASLEEDARGRVRHHHTLGRILFAPFV